MNYRVHFWLGAFVGLLFLVLATTGALAQTGPQPGDQPAAPVRFAVLGDYGSGSANERDVANLIAGWNVDFVVTTGDNNYPSGAASTIDTNIGQFYSRYMYPYQGRYVGGTAPNRFFPSLGNHDWETTNAQPYLDYFTLPGNERYYDFTWGPIHMFAVDSDSREPDGRSSTSAQATWLRNRLAAATEPWKVVYLHHAPYSSGAEHGSNPSLQWPYQQWGASAVLAGHDHDYERIMLNGFPYFVNGLGGASIYSFGTPVNGSVVRYNDDYGALLVTADPASLTFQFVSRANYIVDTYTLTTGAPTSTPPVGSTATRTPTRTPTVPAGSTATRTATRTPTVPAGSTPTRTPTRTATIPPGSTATPIPPTATPGAVFPLRAAFYYPWFPETWGHGTNYSPTLGRYNSSDPAVIRAHIDAMQYGKIAAGIASWWGPGTTTDGRIAALLQGAQGTTFRWAMYYEDEGFGDPPVSTLTADLQYLRDRYSTHPNYLRINGRFVVFVYGDGGDSCAMVDRWNQANTVGAYIVLKVFSGYRTCAAQPDGWHQYGPAAAADRQSGYSYSISPGFWKAGEPVRLARDLNRWQQNIRDMVASGEPFQIITTFNEWGEGTAVESAQEWASASGYGAYLDALHNNGGPPPPPVPPTMTPTRTTVPQASPTATRTAMPPSTATATRTAVLPPTATTTRTALLVGSVTWQGRPSPPNPANQLPLTLTLQYDGGTTRYANVQTDASGVFTVPVGTLPAGMYTWWVKGSQYLARMGTVPLLGAPVTRQEMGLQQAGDVNNDNLVDTTDFVLLRATFGGVCGEPGYDGRADFTGNCLVDITDYTLLKENYGRSGDVLGAVEIPVDGAAAEASP